MNVDELDKEKVTEQLDPTPRAENRTWQHGCGQCERSNAD